MSAHDNEKEQVTNSIEAEPETTIAFELGYVSALSELGKTALSGSSPDLMNLLKQTAVDRAWIAIKAAQRAGHLPGSEIHVKAEEVFRVAERMPFESSAVEQDFHDLNS